MACLVSSVLFLCIFHVHFGHSYDDSESYKSFGGGYGHHSGHDYDEGYKHSERGYSKLHDHSGYDDGSYQPSGGSYDIDFHGGGGSRYYPNTESSVYSKMLQAYETGPSNSYGSGSQVYPGRSYGTSNYKYPNLRIYVPFQDSYGLPSNNYDSVHFGKAYEPERLGPYYGDSSKGYGQEDYDNIQKYGGDPQQNYGYVGQTSDQYRSPGSYAGPRSNAVGHSEYNFDKPRGGYDTSGMSAAYDMSPPDSSQSNDDSTMQDSNSDSNEYPIAPDATRHVGSPHNLNSGNVINTGSAGSGAIQASGSSKTKTGPFGALSLGNSALAASGLGIQGTSINSAGSGFAGFGLGKSDAMMVNALTAKQGIVASKSDTASLSDINGDSMGSSNGVASGNGQGITLTQVASSDSQGSSSFGPGMGFFRFKRSPLDRAFGFPEGPASVSVFPPSGFGVSIFPNNNNTVGHSSGFAVIGRLGPKFSSSGVAFITGSSSYVQQVLPPAKNTVSGETSVSVN